jgi:histidinol-phosphatase
MDDLAFAMELADLADSMSLVRFRDRDLVVESKPDMTPVTEVDRGVERAIRDRIARERPGQVVLGEEYGAEDGPVRWIIDPIDGTKSYVRGIPAWGTLIGLERDGELVVGVASAPALGRRWWAARGGGAFADGRPIAVSGIERLEDAQLCYTSFKAWEEAGLLEPFLALGRRCWRTRGFGDFWQYCLVAEGSAEIALEPGLALWDIAAVKVIVEEAGGAFTDLAGDPRFAAGSVVATNGLLHDEVLSSLTGGSERPRT